MCKACWQIEFLYGVEQLKRFPRIFVLVFLTAATLLSAQASAAVNAVTTASVNMRAGPGVRYAIVAVVPAGQRIKVFGCASSRRWCDVQWRRQRGWISSRFLSRISRRQPLYEPGFVLPPVIYFDFGVYRDRWYRDRPFHRHYNGRPWRRKRNP